MVSHLVLASSWVALRVAEAHPPGAGCVLTDTRVDSTRVASNLAPEALAAVATQVADEMRAGTRPTTRAPLAPAPDAPDLFAALV